MERELREILDAGLAAADPREAVMRSVRLEGDAVLADDARFEPDRIFVVSAGKAAGAMAPELLGSVNGVPRTLLDSGFVFSDPTVDDVVREGLSPSR